MKQNKVTILSDREHVLKRSTMYIGSTTPVHRFAPIIENDKIVYKDIEYIPGVLKLMREIIDNAIDEYVRMGSPDKYKIDILLDDEKIVVSDTGRGIPVVPAQTSTGDNTELLMPVAAFCNLKAGSNWGDGEDASAIGANGVGASLANILSTLFKVKTCDGKKTLILESRNNIESYDYEVTDTPNAKTGTIVAAFLDKEKLNLGDKIPKIYRDLIFFDTIFLSLTYPKIQFTVNQQEINIETFRQLINKYYSDPIVYHETDDVIIGVVPNPDSHEKHIHFINGLDVYNKGKIFEYVEKRLLENLLPKFQYRAKGIKAADIKNKISLHIIIRNFPGPRFSDQMKTCSVNLPGSYPKIAEEIRNICDDPNFIKRIMKSKEIVDPVLDYYKAKQIVEEKKAAKKSLKNKAKHIEKYWKPSKSNKYFIIVEGESAFGGLVSALDREDKGFYPLKGKIMNAIKNSPSKLLANNEVADIIDINGVTMEPDQKDFTFEKIVFATDADLDGFHIQGLLFALAYKYLLPMLERGDIAVLRTPIAVSYKKNRIDDFIFDFSEIKNYSEKNPGAKMEYLKGLGSLDDKMWEELFKRYNFEDLLINIQIQDAEQEFKKLELWMDEDRDYRKKIIKENIHNFNMDTI